MKVKELIESLKKLPEDLEVIVASDAEGNTCSPLANILTGFYIPETTYNGDFYLEMEDVADSDDDEAIEVIALWPTN